MNFKITLNQINLFLIIHFSSIPPFLVAETYVSIRRDTRSISEKPAWFFL